MVRRLNDSRDFWQMVDMPIGHLDDCWLWLGSLHPSGYAYFRWQGKEIKAHRLAYELTFGTIPPGMCVMHTCDVRHCCSPRHLKLGTQRDNVADRHAKGRDAKERHNGQYMLLERAVRGYGVYRAAKLTPAQVLEACELYGTGTYTFTQLGQRYGVARTTMQQAVRGVTWTIVGQHSLPPVPTLSPVLDDRKPRPATKLDADAVREIRALVKTGLYTWAEIGARFGVTATCARFAGRGITWRHVKD